MARLTQTDRKAAVTQIVVFSRKAFQYRVFFQICSLGFFSLADRSRSRCGLLLLEIHLGLSCCVFWDVFLLITGVQSGLQRYCSFLVMSPIWPFSSELSHQNRVFVEHPLTECFFCFFLYNCYFKPFCEHLWHLADSFI